MKIKTVLIQNILLVLGVAAIYEFRAVERLYSMFQARENGFPILDGEGIVITFLGIQFNDDGVHWTEVMATGYVFLTLGIILIVASIGILLWKLRGTSQSR
ncbi:hypothetical protein SAMN05877753_10641 [Bacillus oleivorans]|uniref:Uncharacterized protein n=1 Tax=Bacillus oleivorans TaxID=1448271 RepID=A0A285CXP7_9BACI|nr:hypothetical protein [Bacillus oleivorans]SNX72367.1 hypothetical protein SAMN05877753_10641 [Bacillus oleivorans]